MSTISLKDQLSKLTKPALLAIWNKTLDFTKRDTIMKVMKEKGYFPSEYMKDWDQSVGAYPDYDDPEFLQRLLAKKEFAESFQETWDPGNDPCAADTKFEVTPVQRFAANLMSPRTPYMSALLYHGVGVGKTCSAIQIAEAWLEEYPQEQVIIIAPPTIQGGFRSTIFDISERRLGIGSGTDANRAYGCTGNTYLEMTGTLLERDRERIQRRINRAINHRYQFFGYLQFANYVKSLLKRFERITDPGIREEEQRKLIRREFNGKLLIIDEAHNLRDVMSQEKSKVSEGDENADEPGGKDAGDDMKAGKQMTPYLNQVLDYSYGMKLVLMTATPMYNSYREIIFILNLLLKNDKKAPINEADVFDKDGKLLKSGEELLGSLASRYVSFMRGENPKSFPLRLKPRLAAENSLTIAEYPRLSMRGRVIPEDEKKFVSYLPLVKIPLPSDSENYSASLQLLGEVAANRGNEVESGISSMELGLFVQAGNFVPPGSASDTYKNRIKLGLLNVMDRQSSPRVSYKAKAGTDSKWLLTANLGKYSPKFVYLIKRLATCEGVAFVYSRFIDSGALPLALALEANGYKCYKRETGFLADGVQDGLGGQCALCPLRQANHAEGYPGIESHEFTQAYYGLLTGEQTYTPDRNVIIKGEQELANKNGARLKIVIGSQIASEGVDLRYVREVHVVDSWYHLNKTEQVIGRAIRFCSHSALQEVKRNTTIYLYATYIDNQKETADLYSYRLAFKKAKQVGQVSRALKGHAIDCNLNHDAIIIRGQKPVSQVDSQRVPRTDVNINDVGFTAMCDWVERCDYECKPPITKKEMGTDDSTYSEYAVRWREAQIKERIKAMFADTVMIELANMEDALSDIPVIARTEFLMNIVNNKQFEIDHKGVKGYIKFCNNYFVFQPAVYGDIHIPLAIRMASFPVRRDYFDPEIIEQENMVLVEDEEMPKTDLEAVWKSVKDWTETLTEKWTEEPKIIEDRILMMSHGDNKTREFYNLVLRMMKWFRVSVKGASDAFKRVIQEYIWDNWFTLEEQKTLYDLEMLKDGLFQSGDRKVYRFYNTDSDSIYYDCDRTECGAAIVEAIKGRERIEETAFRNQEAPLGPSYGFLIGKNGLLVFKTNNVPKRGEKWNTGKECGIITKSSQKYDLLEDIGALLKAKGQDDLDLRREIIRSDRVLSSAECCIIMEFVYRYMNATGFDGKQWFFRPANAKILGHRGTALKVIEPVKKKVVVVKSESVTDAAAVAAAVNEVVNEVVNDETSTNRNVKVNVPVPSAFKKKVSVVKTIPE